MNPRTTTTARVVGLAAEAIMLTAFAALAVAIIGDHLLHLVAVPDWIVPLSALVLAVAVPTMLVADLLVLRQEEHAAADAVDQSPNGPTTTR